MLDERVRRGGICTKELNPEEELKTRDKDTACQSLIVIRLVHSVQSFLICFFIYNSGQVREKG